MTGFNYGSFSPSRNCHKPYGLIDLYDAIIVSAIRCYSVKIVERIFDSIFTTV